MSIFAEKAVRFHAMVRNRLGAGNLGRNFRLLLVVAVSLVFFADGHSAEMKTRSFNPDDIALREIERMNWVAPDDHSTHDVYFLSFTLHPNANWFKQQNRSGYLGMDDPEEMAALRELQNETIETARELGVKVELTYYDGNAKDAFPNDLANPGALFPEFRVDYSHINDVTRESLKAQRLLPEWEAERSSIYREFPANELLVAQILLDRTKNYQKEFQRYFRLFNSVVWTQNGLPRKHHSKELVSLVMRDSYLNAQSRCGMIFDWLHDVVKLSPEGAGKLIWQTLCPRSPHLTIYTLDSSEQQFKLMQHIYKRFGSLGGAEHFLPIALNAYQVELSARKIIRMDYNARISTELMTDADADAAIEQGLKNEILERAQTLAQWYPQREAENRQYLRDSPDSADDINAELARLEQEKAAYAESLRLLREGRIDGLDLTPTWE